MVFQKAMDCIDCAFNDYLYEFSSDVVNFKDATENCKNAGGSLARFLDRDTYIKFSKCCSSASAQQYYVGLRLDRSECSENPEGLYKWVESSDCTNKSPLMFPDNATNNCASVFIQIPNDNLNTSARLIDCTAAQRYICQFPKTATSPSPINSTSMLATTVDNADGLNPGLIAGLLIGVVIIFLLLAIVLQLRKMKTHQRKQSSMIQLAEQTSFDENQTNNNPLYNGTFSSATEGRAGGNSEGVGTTVSKNNHVNEYETIEEINQYHEVKNPGPSRF